MASKDGFNFFNKRSEKFEDVKETQPAPPPFSDTYKMNHRNRGVAIIFNHVNFTTSTEWKRNGSDKDRDDLIEMFHILNFNVLNHDDLTVAEVKDVLLMVSQMNHSDSDCLVIVVMSHGDSQKIYANDWYYPTEILWKFFSADNCPSLGGKPKLFFIQACRGTNLHDGFNLTYDSPDGIQQPIYSIPVMADILIMYSTVDGFYSWRDPENGGYFIQSLVKQIINNYKTKDLLQILTCVNRDVAINFTSVEPNNPKYNNKKQMCSIVSMLTRELYFFNK